MVNVKENLVGKRFSSLTVIERDADHYTKGGHVYPRWKCKCECGKIISVLQSSLKNGGQKSCGCQQRIACKKFNDYTVNEKIVEVKLTNCDEIMICDLGDWERMKSYCWSKNKIGYAEARVEGKTRLFHHFVIQCESGKVRDHINHNKLDNRRDNLRCVSYTINNLNKGKVRKNILGITGAYRSGKKIVMRVCISGKTIYLGSYETIDEAAKARKEFLKKVGIEVQDGETCNSERPQRLLPMER